MTKLINKKPAYGFVVATASLMLHEPRAAPPEEDITVMFSFGAVNGHPTLKEIEATAQLQDLDVVHAEFRPGRENEGPSNFIIRAKIEDVWSTWRRCDLWTNADRGLTVLVPRGKDFAFTFSGSRLLFMRGRVDEFDKGIARAKVALKELMVARALVDKRLAN